MVCLQSVASQTYTDRKQWTVRRSGITRQSVHSSVILPQDELQGLYDGIVVRRQVGGQEQGGMKYK